MQEYQKLCEYAEALEENWGKPPGERAGGQGQRVVRNVCVCV